MENHHWFIGSTVHLQTFHVGVSLLKLSWLENVGGCTSTGCTHRRLKKSWDPLPKQFSPSAKDGVFLPQLKRELGILHFKIRHHVQKTNWDQSYRVTIIFIYIYIFFPAFCYSQLSYLKDDHQSTYHWFFNSSIGKATAFFSNILEAHIFLFLIQALRAWWKTLMRRCKSWCGSQMWSAKHVIHCGTEDSRHDRTWFPRSVRDKPFWKRVT